MCTATTGVEKVAPHFPLVNAALEPGAKLAEMVCPLTTVDRQVPVPLHGAPQPVNTKPDAGMAVRVSAV